MTLVSGDIRFVWIFAVGSSPGRGRQTTVGLTTTAVFSVYVGYIFSDTPRGEASVIIWRYAVRRRLFSGPIPKMRLLFVVHSGHFGLVCDTVV